MRRFRSGFRKSRAFRNTKLGFLDWIDSRNIYLWSMQRLIGESVERNANVVCKGGHQWGKTFLAACLIVWWVLRHPLHEVSVVIVAPSWDQITDGILLQVESLKQRLGLPGRINLHKQYAGWKIGGHTVVSCRSPQQGRDTTKSQTITGKHNRYLLVVIEEGCGLDRPTWRNAESWALNDTAHIFSPGNPLDAETAFGDCFKEGSAWTQHTVSTMDSPAFTDERASCPPEVLEALASPAKIAKWKQEMTLAEYAARVLGMFPTAAQLQIFSQALIDACKRVRGNSEGRDIVLGLDPAGTGVDNCRLYAYQPPNLWNVTPTEIEHGGTDAHVAKYALKTYRDLGAAHINVDGFGIGTDVGRRLASEGASCTNVLTGTNGGNFNKERYGSKRSEMHFDTRGLMQAGRVSLEPSEELERELKTVRQKLKPDRRTHVETKEDHARRLGYSPGSLDATLLATMQPDTFMVGISSATH